MTGMVLAALLAGCSQTPEFEASVQAPRAARGTGAGGFLSLEVLATSGGEAIGCDDTSVEVVVEVAGADGHFASLPAGASTVVCDEGRTGDLAVVVDNSGSEDGFLPWLQEGAGNMVDGVLAHGGRSSLVRVSTDAELREEMTSDAAVLRDAVDALHVANGWTALYDGIRLGNETIGAAAGARPEWTDLESFCAADRTLGVVAFTDGQDNNSAGEHDAVVDNDRYPGDGIDTRFDDLLDLRVDGISTPVYTIGLGRGVLESELQDLATRSGGRYLSVDDEADLPGVFDIIGDYFDASRNVCAELPTLECGAFTVRVTTTWEHGGTTHTDVQLETVHLECEAPSEGRVATVLLTTSDPNIPRELAGTLSRNVVEWVSPVLRPRVLVVLDDNNHGEDRGDAQVVNVLLSDSDNLDVTYVEEPEGGLIAADLAAVDVVWFSNPGYPMDDVATFATLQGFSADGGGVVLQGDDMTWSWGHGFDMSPLTHTDHVSNGTQACGQRIDNLQGGHYIVTVAEAEHAVTTGIEGERFLYGNDIDHSVPRGEGEVVLATATVAGDEGCMTPVPVVIGFDPR